MVRAKIIVIMPLLLLSACRSEPVAKAHEVVTTVRVATIGVADTVPVVDAVGTVRYRREPSLGFTSAGRVVVITVNEGDHIAKGQLLAALDSATVGAALSSAAAEVARASAELARSETLMKQGWITRARLETARSTSALAYANVRSARFQVANARIYAPSAGIILARTAEPAQVVAAGQPVLQLGEAAGGMVLRVPVTDRDAARLAAGAPARITLAALGDVAISGRLIEIGGRADRATGTFDCLIALPADARLRVGQVGQVAIIARADPQIESVAPSAAVFAARAGEGFVYVLGQDNRPVLRKVVLGAPRNDGIAIVSGLQRGERVIISGVDRLRAGQKVTPESATVSAPMRATR